MRCTHLVIVVLVLSFVVGCTDRQVDPSGLWKAETSYYRATYKIAENGDGYDCQVLAYNDGTRSFSTSKSNPVYLFKNVPANSIDGNTGATQSKPKKSSFQFKLLGPDQLQVTQRVSGQKRIEIWKRSPSKNN